MTVRVLQGHCADVLSRLPEESVHCCITSIPYWRLRSYGTPPQAWADGWVGEWGQEPEPERYVEHTVEVFRAVKRVLRRDGTLWLNIGDTYWNVPGGTQAGLASDKAKEAARQVGRKPIGKHPVLKQKDLVGIPWRVAFALQADGWWLRSEVIWHKPNPLPESVTDRPTKAHEPVFLLTKSGDYFYDAEAIKEPAAWERWGKQTTIKGRPSAIHASIVKDRTKEELAAAVDTTSRNKRSVWTIPVASWGEAHFATFPPALVEPCVKASTSEMGCCLHCGAPWEREVERTPMGVRAGPKADDYGSRTTAGTSGTMVLAPSSRTTGWRPSCRCAGPAPVPCVVLDPCGGSGTVGMVADRLGRDAVLIELKAEYAAMAERRIRGDAPLFAQVEAAAG